MITMFIMLLLGLGIIAVVVSVIFKLIRFVFSLPIIGSLAVVFIVMMLLFGL